MKYTNETRVSNLTDEENAWLIALVEEALPHATIRTLQREVFDGVTITQKIFFERMRAMRKGQGWGHTTVDLLDTLMTDNVSRFFPEGVLPDKLVQLILTSTDHSRMEGKINKVLSEVNPGRHYNVYLHRFGPKTFELWQAVLRSFYEEDTITGH